MGGVMVDTRGLLAVRFFAVIFVSRCSEITAEVLRAHLSSRLGDLWTYRSVGTLELGVPGGGTIGRRGRWRSLRSWLAGPKPLQPSALLCAPFSNVGGANAALRCRRPPPSGLGKYAREGRTTSVHELTESWRVSCRAATRRLVYYLRLVSDGDRNLPLSGPWSVIAVRPGRFGAPEAECPARVRCADVHKYVTWLVINTSPAAVHQIQPGRASRGQKEAPETQGNIRRAPPNTAHLTAARRAISLTALVQGRANCNRRLCDSPNPASIARKQDFLTGTLVLIRSPISRVRLWSLTRLDHSCAAPVVRSRVSSERTAHPPENRYACLLPRGSEIDTLESVRWCLPLRRRRAAKAS